ncbi:WhiB family transcriptional regulator [Gordonia sp. ABSL49_1]|uniref:WhiB family transcriptional regulator n=1 Tax=Gordonia sp. ABSL49_1 TaxID=2920941 RepID=UPI001F0E3640|nr:WhiB family transcriptional regulator [Gordonia sp. ABSL49_1]MCH5645672.1 WhiB family transcriptional regulator [Gordonia sp. ABSL49_1]
MVAKYRGPARREGGWVDLTAEILRGTADLSGANCIGSETLFDPKARNEESVDAAYRHRAAAELCRTCPAVDACARWAATQPDTNAVVGGRRPVLPGNPGRPRKASAA